MSSYFLSTGNSHFGTHRSGALSCCPLQRTMPNPTASFLLFDCPAKGGCHAGASATPSGDRPIYLASNARLGGASDPGWVREGMITKAKLFVTQMAFARTTQRTNPGHNSTRKSLHSGDPLDCAGDPTLLCSFRQIGQRRDKGSRLWRARPFKGLIGRLWPSRC